MLVRAIAKGYIGTVLREPGQIFRLKTIEGLKEVETKNDLGKVVKIEKVKHTFTPEEQFSERWMEKVEDDAPSKAGKKTSKAAIGARPAPPDEDEVAARIAAADEMASESAARDLEVI